MSSITEEDLAKIMRPGLRVVRGKDWQEFCQTFNANHSVDEDGNGEGTITQMYKFGCYVKWDRTGSEKSYYQGYSGYFCLRLAVQKTLEGMKLEKLGEKLL